MIKVVIFDFDGVIVESVDVKTRAFASLFTEEGQDVINAIVAYHVSHGGVSRFDKFRHIYANILQRPLSDAEFARLCEDFSRIVLDEVIKASYVDGAAEFLEQHSSEFIFYIVSATPEDELKNILHARSLSNYFRYAFGSPMTKTDAIRKLLVEADVAPFEAVFVGDALTDYMAAQETGVNFIARCEINDQVFGGVQCMKIRDIAGLHDAIKRIST